MTDATKPKYCIDTSSLCQLWTRACPPDLFPGVWDKMDTLIDERRLIAPVDVLHELVPKNDGLHGWAKGREAEMFYEIDDAVQAAVRRVLTVCPKLINPNSLKSNADPFVVALAAVEGCYVVTEETMSRSPNEVKIPNACKEMRLEYGNVLQLLRSEGWKFKAA